MNLLLYIYNLSCDIYIIFDYYTSFAVLCQAASPISSRSARMLSSVTAVSKFSMPRTCSGQFLLSKMIRVLRSTWNANQRPSGDDVISSDSYALRWGGGKTTLQKLCL